MLSIHASPYFWKLILGRSETRRVAPIFPSSPELSSMACVRIAFKSFQMGVPFDFGSVDLNKGTLVKSKKSKLTV